MTVYMAVAAVFEERDLLAHFGKQYQEYRRRVPMFIPRLKPLALGTMECGVQVETSLSTTITEGITCQP